MGNLESTVHDLSKGYVPIVIVCAIVITALLTGQWMKSNEANVANLDKKVSDLQLQLTQLSTQVSQLTLTLAKGPVLPENVVYKADLLKFCVSNRSLTCPQF